MVIFTKIAFHLSWFILSHQTPIFKLQNFDFQRKNMKFVLVLDKIRFLKRYRFDTKGADMTF